MPKYIAPSWLLLAAMAIRLEEHRFPLAGAATLVRVCTLVYVGLTLAKAVRYVHGRLAERGTPATVRLPLWREVVTLENALTAAMIVVLIALQW